MERKAKGPKTIVLVEPVNFGSEEVTEVVLQRPKGKHLRKLPMDPGVGDFLDLAGNLCGRPRTFMDELDAEDVMKIAEAVADFLPGGTPTGSNGSGSLSGKSD